MERAIKLGMYYTTSISKKAARPKKNSNRNNNRVVISSIDSKNNIVGNTRIRDREYNNELERVG